MKAKTQKMKLKNTGSFFNWLMANNDTAPKVGEWVTRLWYSDRTVYKVVEVSPDGSKVKLEECDTKGDTSLGDLHMGHQNWIHTPNGQYLNIVYRNNAWRIVAKKLRWDIDFCANYNASKMSLIEYIGQDIYDSLYDEEGDLKVVEGYTFMQTQYIKVSLLFGKADYYYDWER
jgi:hypothetical protein